jgi:hypothetical protein
MRVCACAVRKREGEAYVVGEDVGEVESTGARLPHVAGIGPLGIDGALLDKLLQGHRRCLDHELVLALLHLLQRLL